MTLYLYKIGELNGYSHVKIPLKSSAILIIENIDKILFHVVHNSQSSSYIKFKKWSFNKIFKL